jgi:23S rRNA (guanosine2251-2'-O)-methyltransferase
MFKNSRATGWVYGVNPVREALRGMRTVYEVFIYRNKAPGIKSEISRLSMKKAVKVSLVEKRFFSDFPKGHQGVAARVSDERTYSIEDLFNISKQRKEPPFYIIIDGVVDPGNLGAILRTAEVGGVHGVVVQKRGTASGETVSKTSAGAIEYMPVVKVANIKHAIRAFRERGLTVYGAEADSETTYWLADLRGPLALVIGSEGKGIRKTVRQYCDHLIKIPILGRIDSLNVSVAAGILIFETVRQRYSPHNS